MENPTSNFFENIFRIIRIIGVGNFWITKDKWPPFCEKLHALFQIILNITLFGLILLEYGGVFAKNLDEKQKIDNIIFIWGHTIFASYEFAVKYNMDGIKKLVLKQCVTLPNLFDNEKIEFSVKKCIKMYTLIFVISVNSTLFFYGVGGIAKVIKGDAFVTVITYWPSVEDRSVLAELSRIFFYLLWFYMMTRVLSFFFIVFSQAIYLRHQYMHLEHYFLNLEEIFKEDLSSRLKELKFEEKFKFGLRLHAETLWCVRTLQKHLGAAYNGQTALNLYCLVLLMAQALRAERTLVNLLVTFLTVTSVILTTGLFMGNAGDITVAADKLPDAIFYSGWHLCKREMYEQLRPLIIMALQNAQKPVVITAFNQLPMSYSTFVSIVKTSYSIFTVLY